MHDARVAFDEGRLADARAAAREVEAGPGEGRAAVIAGGAAYLMGDLPAALTHLRRAVRRRPNDFTARRAYAVALLDAGRRTAAQRQMNRALQLNPRLPLPAGFALRPPVASRVDNPGPGS